MTHCLHVAGKLPIKTLVARQLPTNVHVHICHVLCRYVCTYVALCFLFDVTVILYTVNHLSLSACVYTCISTTLTCMYVNVYICTIMVKCCMLPK